jgi:hypothetical protein
MRTIIWFIVVITNFSPARAAFAQSASITTWVCWYDGEASVRCRLRPAPSHVDTSSPAATGQVQSLFRALGEDPSDAEGPIVIPLHTIPYDMEFVRELAQSVMCGRNPLCSIAFGKSAAEVNGYAVANR